MGITYRSIQRLMGITYRKNVLLAEHDNVNSSSSSPLSSQSSSRRTHISTTQEYCKAPFGAWTMGRITTITWLLMLISGELAWLRFLCPEAGYVYSIMGILGLQWLINMIFKMEFNRHNDDILCAIITYLFVHTIWLCWYHNADSEWKWNWEWAFMATVRHLYNMIMFPMSTFIIALAISLCHYRILDIIYKTVYGSHIELYNLVVSNGRLLNRPWSPSIDTTVFRKHLHDHDIPNVIQDLVAAYLEAPPMLDLFKHDYKTWITDDIWLDGAQAVSFQYLASNKINGVKHNLLRRYWSRLMNSTRPRFVHLPWKIGFNEPILRIPIVNPHFVCPLHENDNYISAEMVATSTFEIALSDRANHSQAEVDQAMENIQLLVTLQGNGWSTQHKQCKLSNDSLSKPDTTTMQTVPFPMFRFNSDHTPIVSIDSSHSPTRYGISIARFIPVDDATLQPWDESRFQVPLRVGSDPQQMKALMEWCFRAHATPHTKEPVRWVRVRLGIAPWRRNPFNQISNGFNLVFNLVEFEGVNNDSNSNNDNNHYTV